MPIVYSLKYLPSILHRLVLKNNGVFFYPMHLIEPQSAPLNDRFVEDSVTFTWAFVMTSFHIILQHDDDGFAIRKQKVW